jgi:hypothetical protein
MGRTAIVTEMDLRSCSGGGGESLGRIGGSFDVVERLQVDSEDGLMLIALSTRVT